MLFFTNRMPEVIPLGVASLKSSMLLILHLLFILITGFSKEKNKTRARLYMLNKVDNSVPEEQRAFPTSQFSGTTDLGSHLLIQNLLIVLCEKERTRSLKCSHLTPRCSQTSFGCGAPWGWLALSNPNNIERPDAFNPESPSIPFPISSTRNKNRMTWISSRLFLIPFIQIRSESASWASCNAV